MSDYESVHDLFQQLHIRAILIFLIARYPLRKLSRSLRTIHFINRNVVLSYVYRSSRSDNQREESGTIVA